MSAELERVRAALAAHDLAAARQHLIPILKTAPSAEAWVLAARAASGREQAITCLRKALDLDPFHTEANRLLFRLEGAVPPSAQAELERERARTEAVRQALPAAPLPEKKVRRRRRFDGWRAVGCLGLIVFSASFTLLVLNMVGVVTGVFGTISRFTGGPTPVTVFEGVPLTSLEDAAALVDPSSSQPAQVRTANVLDDGFSQEYTFEGVPGQSMAIYVQFLSVGANRVSRNVAVLRPDGSSGLRDCELNRILQGDNNIAYICAIDREGTWRVRILGRAGESVGAYFVGVQPIPDGSW